MIRSKKWTSLARSVELSLATTLSNGQCFNFRRLDDDGTATTTPPASSSSPHFAARSSSLSSEYIGTIGRAVIHLRDDGEHVVYNCRANGSGSGTIDEMVRDYFRLDVDLGDLRREWGRADERTGQIVAALPGMRLIRQDPVECLFSFIVSSNNNIARITQLLNKLRCTHGDRLFVHNDSTALHAFPTVAQLIAIDEQEFRRLGFGYRARYLSETAAKLDELGGAPWLLTLRSKPAAEVQEALCQFTGVGRKVADCVALFSLDQDDVVPIDTHVWQIAVRDFDPTLASAKSLTPAVYDRVADLFRSKYPRHTGWAHSVLFAAELPVFRSRLPQAIQDRMAEAAREEKAKKEEDRRRRRAAKEAKGEKGETEEKEEKGRRQRSPSASATPREKRRRTG